LSNPIVIMGDKTSHGGTVITCSQFSDTLGKGWARACGASLIADQMFTYTTPSSGAAPGAASNATPDNLLQGFGVIAPGLAGAYQDEAVADGDERYRGRFQLVDATTGAPVPGQGVRVRSTGGQYVNGTTDDEGFTPWVERDVRESLAFDLVQEGTA